MVWRNRLSTVFAFEQAYPQNEPAKLYGLDRSMVTDMTMTSTSVPTNVVEFRDWLAQRAPVTDEASAIDQIRLLNQRKA